MAVADGQVERSQYHVAATQPRVQVQSDGLLFQRAFDQAVLFGEPLQPGATALGLFRVLPGDVAADVVLLFGNKALLPLPFLCLLYTSSSITMSLS